jgi:hypothetical protein
MLRRYLKLPRLIVKDIEVILVLGVEINTLNKGVFVRYGTVD